MRSMPVRGTAGLFAVLAMIGCGTGAQRSANSEPVPRPLTPAALVTADSGRPPYTAADVRFMQGMIHHHAQAVVMARLVPSRSASSAVRVLAERIDVAQRDEIAFMREWLSDRGLYAPDPLTHHRPGAIAHHDSREPRAESREPLMPGMLTPEQMKQLETAHDAEFDRLFLTFMIQHHEGALVMVLDLFASPGAGQDTYLWKFASDVEADQSIEIERMQTMVDTPSPDRP